MFAHKDNPFNLVKASFFETKFEIICNYVIMRCVLVMCLFTIQCDSMIFGAECTKWCAVILSNMVRCSVLGAPRQVILNSQISSYKGTDKSPLT